MYILLEYPYHDQTASQRRSNRSRLQHRIYGKPDVAVEHAHDAPLGSGGYRVLKILSPLLNARFHGARG
jgi:hypothetical protein